MEEGMEKWLSEAELTCALVRELGDEGLGEERGQARTGWAQGGADSCTGHGHNSMDNGQLTAWVEAVPAEPQDEDPEDKERGVVARVVCNLQWPLTQWVEQHMQELRCPRRTN